MEIKSRYARVMIYKSVSGQYTTYRICWRLGKQRQRESRSDEDEAIRRAEEIFIDLEKGVASRPEASGEHWAYYQKCREMMNGRPLMDAVEFYLAHHNGASTGVSMQLSEVSERFIAAKELEQQSDRYLKSIKTSLKSLNKAVKKPIRAVRVQDLDEWLAGFKDARTRRNNRGYVVILFRWARTKGFLPQTEMTVAERTDSPKVVVKEPGVLTPEELKQLLEGARRKRPKLLPFLAIGAFAGLRAAEIERLTWDHIDLKAGLIKLPSAITKTMRRRTVPIKPCLKAWLELCDGPISTPNAHDKLLRLREIIGLKHWPHNALRHSAVSYLMAREPNAAQVAEWCGHTVAQLQSNYKALVAPDQAAAWFSTFPAHK